LDFKEEYKIYQIWKQKKYIKDRFQSTKLIDFLIKILTSNIRNVLLRETENVAVIRNWDFIEVRAKVAEEAPMVLDLLKRTPGIHHILEVEEYPFETMHDIFEQTLAQVVDLPKTHTLYYKGCVSFSIYDY